MKYSPAMRNANSEHISFITDNYKAHELYQYLFINLAPLPLQLRPNC